MDFEVKCALEECSWVNLLSDSPISSPLSSQTQTSPIIAAIFDKALPYCPQEEEEELGSVGGEVTDQDLLFSKRPEEDEEGWRRRLRIGLRKLHNGLTSPSIPVQDRALAACIKNAGLEPKERIRFSHFQEVMNGLVAHAGIYKGCQLRRIMEKSSSQRIMRVKRQLSVGFLQYWLNTTDEMIWRRLLCEKYIQKLDLATLRTVSAEMWVAQDDPSLNKTEREFIVRGSPCGAECESCICKTPLFRDQEDLGEEFKTISVSSINPEIGKYMRRRVEVIASLLKSYSALEENAGQMAKNLGVLRFVMLIIQDKDRDTRLARCGFNIFRDMGLHLTLHYPLDQYPITARVTGIFRTSLQSQERFRILGALELIAKLGKKDCNERILMRYRPHLPSITQFLNKKDATLVFYSLEAVHVYSTMGTAMCTWLSQVFVVNFLVNLLSVQVAHFQENVPPERTSLSHAASHSTSATVVRLPPAGIKEVPRSRYRTSSVGPNSANDNSCYLRQGTRSMKFPATKIIVQPGLENLLRKRLAPPLSGPAAKLYKSLTSPKFEELIARTTPPPPKLIDVQARSNDPLDERVYIRTIPRHDWSDFQPKTRKQVGQLKTQSPSFPSAPKWPPVQIFRPSPTFTRQELRTKSAQLNTNPALQKATPSIPPTAEPAINLENLCQLYGQLKDDHLNPDRELIIQLHKTAALTLRNMAYYSSKARSILRTHSKTLLRIAASKDPCSDILVNLVYDLVSYNP